MIYLDNSASTQIREEVLNVISHELKYSFANPSSPYKPARKSRISIDKSREIFAEILNCSENEIIFTSSISVYGPDESQKDESTILTPNSGYGYSKMIAENIHRSWQLREENRALTVIRPAVVFGPGEGGNFTRLAAMLKKGFFVYPGRKDTIKACIYIEDLIFAMESARSTDNSYELLNGAYTSRYTLEEIVEAFKVDYFPGAKLFMVPKAFVLTAAKLFKMMNFLNIGIHPDRVMKLIKSTNIYPLWLEQNNVELPGDLKTALIRWSDATDGKFD